MSVGWIKCIGGLRGPGNISRRVFSNWIVEMSGLQSQWSWLFINDIGSDGERGNVEWWKLTPSWLSFFLVIGLAQITYTAFFEVLLNITDGIRVKRRIGILLEKWNSKEWNKEILWWRNRLGKKKISKNVFYLVCSADLRTKEIHTMWKLYVDLHTPILRFYSCEGFYFILTKVYAKQSWLRVYFKTNCHSLYIYHVTT